MIYLTLSLGIIFHGQVLGKYFFPKSSWLLATLFGVVCYFSIQSIIQSIWFYSDRPLLRESDMLTVASSMFICNILVLFLKSGDENINFSIQKWPFKKILSALLIAGAGLVSSAYVIISCFRSAIMDSIRTPWPLLPAGIIAAITFIWLSVLLASWICKSRGLTVFQAIIAIFTTTAMAPLIYRIGFGFDGFLHVAAQKVLLVTGSLSPKPFYYLGQYVFSTWLSRVGDIPLEMIDRWLVPLAAAILIPIAFAVAEDSENNSNLLFFLFLAPLSVFINTTPQSFAYVLCLVSLILSMGFSKGRVRPMSALLLSAWAIAIHPLAGVPIFFIILSLSLINLNSNKYKTFNYLLASLGALAGAASVPVLFYFLSKNSSTAINWNLATIFSLGPWKLLLYSFIPWIQNSFTVFPAWASLSLKALPFILLTAAVITTLTNKKDDRAPVIFLTSYAILLFIASAILKSAGDFAFLIDYERGNYADRLNILAHLCLLPAAWPGLAYILKEARKRQPALCLFILLGSLSFAGAQGYNALPRNDALITGHGWSVGQADIEAVKAIERDSAGLDYTVLANQSVSAAAVSQFGFKRYADDVFFYPIPTGGPLYELFLNMTYREPSAETVIEAGGLGKSKLVYVVLNDYWWNAANVAEQISGIADNKWEFGNPEAGEGHSVSVYKFDLNKPIKRKTDPSGS